MATSNSELRDSEREARANILKAIAEGATRPINAAGLKDLAEAYSLIASVRPVRPGDGES